MRTSSDWPDFKALPSITHSRSAPAHELPDVPALLRWLTSWIQPSGAIHGFHNHSVWGGNPYRWGDFTSGHTTFAAFLLPALASLEKRGLSPAGELLDRMLAFQMEARQPNGEFAHIGFQVGESLNLGLIHNMVPSIALLLTIGEMTAAKKALYLEKICATVEGVFRACDCFGGEVASPASSCANQEYARQWARLAFAEITGQSALREAAFADLETLGRHFLVPGLPDTNSHGVLRFASDPRVVEPAEYYGLMILPLLMAYRLSGDRRFLEQASGMSRHIIRSSWRDSAGFLRFHRIWYRTPGDAYTCIREPMLIAGMGFTLEGIRECAKETGNAEMEDYLSDCHRTLAHYQHPTGFFLSATGWKNEADIVPCPAWHSQDAWHLLRTCPISNENLTMSFSPPPPALILGETCFYAETGPHWKIGDYLTQDTFALLGRKDAARFGRDMAWVGGPRALPANFQFPQQLDFLKTDHGLVCCHPLPTTWHVMNASPQPLLFPSAVNTP